MLTVGALQVQCSPKEKDGVDRLAVSRGLLTCCRPHILLSSDVDAAEVKLLGVLIKTCVTCVLLAVIPKHIIS